MKTLTVLGVGSLRHSPAVIASIANYFGEEELELRLFERNPEMLDLFESFARLCIDTGYSRHTILATADHQEALDAVDTVIVQLESEPSEILERICADIPRNADCLSLLAGKPLPRRVYQVADWPEPLDEASSLAMPLQLLRWIRCEEPVSAFVDSHSHSPVKRWLEDPTCLPFYEA